MHIDKRNNKDEKVYQDKLIVVLITLAVISVITAGFVFALPYLKQTELEFTELQTDEVVQNYATTETNTQQWDISATENDHVIATLSDDGVLTISGTGKMKNWDGLTSVPWYSIRSNIKSVVIENGVTSIGNDAFYSCESLSSINIPEGVTSIGYYAFERCTSLTSVNIPSSVTSIRDWGFQRCTSLTNIKVDKNNQSYMDDNGVLYTKNKTKIIRYPIGKGETEYSILAGVTSIENYAFSGCTSLTSVSIPSSVTSIGNRAFEECTSLTSVNIPSSVTSIGNDAFYSCESLTSVNIPSSVTSIGHGSFERCSSLTSLNMPSNLISIGNRAFYLCSSLTSLNVPSSLMSIGYQVFVDCKNLTSINIPSSVTSIGDYAFQGCTSLTSINIPEGVKSIEKYTFLGCTSLTSVSIPSSVTSIGNGAFEKCTSLTSVNIPSSVTSIGDDAFWKCTSLTSINIPSSVTSIGEFVFENCKLTIAVETGKEEQEIMPEILARALDENDILHITKEFKLTNCAMNETGDKIKVNITTANTKTVSIKVNDGALMGLTVVVVVPSGTITYSTTSYTKETVDAILHIAEGEKITNNNGSNIYTFKENGEFTFTYVTKDGVEKTATAKVNNIDKEAPSIKFSPNGTENKVKDSCVVLNVEDNLSGFYGNSVKYIWNEKENNVDKEEITNTLKNNETLKIENKTGIYYLWVYAEDKAGNEKIERSNAFYIDNTAPTAKVTYSTEKLTNQQVVATIKANEEIQNVEGWTLSEDKLSLTKTYTDNTEENGENITIRDIAGNTYTVNVKIRNIDKEAPIADVTYSTEKLTNQQVVATIKANEEIQNVEGWTLSEDKLSLTKTYTDNTEENGENITIRDIAGNTYTVNVEVTNIYKFKVNDPYAIKDKYIARVEPNTQYNEFIKNIEANIDYTITEGDKTVGGTDIIKTGQILKVADETYTIVVIGDLTGDGKIELSELARISKIKAEKIPKTEVSEIEKMAIDVSLDGKIDTLDLAKIAKAAASK